MRRVRPSPFVLITAVLLVAAAPLAGVAAASPIASTPADEASTAVALDHEDDHADWREYDSDEELDVDNSDGLNETELEMVVSRSMVRIEEIRGLEFQERPEVTVVTREEFQGEFEGLMREPTDEQAAFHNAKHKALFLVGEDEDSVAVQGENRNVSVGGFYSPETEQLVIVSDSEQPQMDEVILGHELIHALQDQHFNLSEYDQRTRDGYSAQNGLIEGSASYVEYEYRQLCEGDEWQCVTPPEEEPGGEQNPEREPANFGLLLLDYQPYSDGPTFVDHLHEDGGWERVDAAFDNPPRTSQQIIDPERYPDDEPRDVTIEDSQGEEWDRLRPDERPDHGRMGMAAISTMFVYPLYHSEGQHAIVSRDEWFNYDENGQQLDDFDPLNYDTKYATGWDGDRFHAYENGDGDLAYVWRIAWESPGDAETFVDGFDQLVEYWGGERVAEDAYEVDDGGFAGAYHVSVEDDVVTIVHAPDVETLTDVHEDAEPTVAEDDDEPADDESADDEETTPEDDNESADDNETTPDDDEPEMPGFGVVAAVVAALLAALLARRRV